MTFWQHLFARAMTSSNDDSAYHISLISSIITSMRHHLRVFIVLLSVLLLSLSCRREEKSQAPIGESNQADVQGLRVEIRFSGRIVFQSDLDGDNEIYLLTRGQIKKLTDNTWDDTYPRWSPDGKKIAFSANRDGNYDIFIMDDIGENILQVTASPQDELDAAWAPDGQSIVFTERVKKPFGDQLSLWIMNLSSKEKRRVIPDFSNSHILSDLSPRSPLLAFTGKKMLGWDVFLYDLEAQKYKQLTEGGKACRSRFSPDGQKIVYVSHKADGKGDIWTMNPDGSDQQRITERDEAYDYFPSWSPDGKQVVFCSGLKSAYADKGDWALYLVNVVDKSVIPLFDSPGRDVFPDWR